MPSLFDLQDGFAHAVLDAAVPVPAGLNGARQRRAERRFAVYRNNVAVGLIEALAARFSVVKRLVGDEFFAAMAHRYILTEPPASPILLHYGEGFADFIADFAPATPLPYLADVARLEYARGRAYHAAEADPVGRQAFAALAPDRIGAVRVVLHPSVSILRSPHPVLSIWRVNQDEAPVAIEDWTPQSTLVGRPHLDVEMRRLASGVDHFLIALGAGESIAGAVAVASAATETFSASDGLATLIGANLAIDLR